MLLKDILSYFLTSDGVQDFNLRCKGGNLSLLIWHPNKHSDFPEFKLVDINQLLAGKKDMSQSQKRGWNSQPRQAAGKIPPKSSPLDAGKAVEDPLYTPCAVPKRKSPCAKVRDRKRLRAFLERTRAASADDATSAKFAEIPPQVPEAI